MKLDINLAWDTDKNIGCMSLAFNGQTDMTITVRSHLHACQALSDVIEGRAPTHYPDVGDNLRFSQTAIEQPWGRPDGRCLKLV